VVHKKVKDPVEYIDLTALTRSEQQSHIAQLLEDEQRNGFNLVKAPLIYFRLVRLEDEKYELIRSFHHILMDAWCISLIMVDLVQAYEALVAGNPVTMRSPRPYRDYIGWLKTRDPIVAEKFWQQQLQGLDAPTPLVVEHSARRNQYTQAVVVENADLQLSKQDSSSLQRFCQQNKITPNTMLQGAWGLLLSRYSGNSDVVFGVTVSGRPPEMEGIEEMVGLFINTLPLRVSVDEQVCLVQWLQTLQGLNLDMREFEHSALVDIQQWSEFSRGEELFDSILVYENAPIDESLLQGSLKFSMDDSEHSVHTHYGLTVVAMPFTQMGLRISYDVNRFTRITVERMLGHFKQLLLNFIAAPSSTLAQLDMLSASERKQLLVDWNQTEHAFELDKSYSQLFAAQVAQRPEQLAVVCDEQKLTYRELDQRSTSVAVALLEAGAGTDQLIAVLAPRGLEFLVAMIAVFKAGAAYLPLEIKHPEKRLTEIVHLSDATLLLHSETQSAQAKAILSNALAESKRSPKALSINQLCSAGDTQVDSQIECRGKPDDLAYVIFTSGSTGTPKGALVEQAGMLNNIFGKVPALGLNENDRIAQTASVAFDISVWQFLAAPIVGACVEIFVDSVSQDPQQLLAAIKQRKITILETVPAMMRSMLLVSEDANDLASLRWLLPTGEALPPALCSEWFARFPDITLMNAYGPAECSDDVAFYPIDKPASLQLQAMPVGKPTANNQLFIVDAQLRPVPIGVGGEICVAGVGVGRGYLNDPERTREVFIDNPFAAGQRFYRTGDLGRYNEEGVVEFLGRRDQQVKIRGHRIELGEIEAKLQHMPAVKDAAVIVHSDARGEQQLVAYWVMREDAEQGVNAQQLTQALREQLPPYMAPALIIELAQLPLNTNGKVDRKQLTNREIKRHIDECAQVAPRTATEQALYPLWQDVLGLESFCINDSFFRLGGHSLLATQVVSRIRTTLKTELPLKAFFEYPCVAQLAEHIDQQRLVAGCESSSVDTLALSVCQPRPDKVPLSFAQQRLWFIEQLNPGSSHFNIPFAARLTGELNIDALQRSFKLLIERHEVLRTAFPVAQGSAWQQSFSAVEFTLLETSAQAADYQQSSIPKQLQTWFEKPFDLSKPALIRAQLIRISAEQHVLAVCLHHLVSDAWSAMLAMRELTQNYALLATGQQPNTSPLAIQYADFAICQRSFLQGKVLTQQLQYWERALAAKDSTIQDYFLALPTDKVRPAVQSNQSGTIVRKLSASLSAQLHDFAAVQKQSTFSVILAGFGVLMQRLSGQQAVILGTPASNRNQIETQELLGILLNNLPLRIDFSDPLAFAALAKKVSDELLSAQQHQDLPFEQLVDHLKLPRSLDCAPLFQVMVAQQLAVEKRSQFEGVVFEELTTMLTHSEHDLDLHITSAASEPVALELMYARDLFNEDTAIQWLAGFEQLLTQLLETANTTATQAVALNIEAYIDSRSTMHSGVRPQQEVLHETDSSENLQTPTEQKLAQLWAQVLDIPFADIGRSGNFFHLGGHSLLATVLFAKIRDTFNTAPALRQLFETPVLEDLAHLLDELVQDVTQQSSGVSFIASSARPARLPLSHEQQRLWFLSKLSVDSSEYNITSAFEFTGELQKDSLEKSLKALVDKHEILRSRVLEDDEGEYLKIVEAQPFTLTSQTQECASAHWPQKMQEHAAQEAKVIFVLDSQAPIRGRLIEHAGSDKALFLLSLHHSVGDEWSLQLLIQELHQNYHALVQGSKEQALKQSAPSAQHRELGYIDYSIWQQQKEQQQRYQQQLTYWQSQLKGGDYVLDLPTDFPRVAHTDNAAGSCFIQLPVGLSEQLRNFAQTRGVTLYMLLLGALKVFLASYTNQRDIRVGTPVANRQQGEVQDVVGCFVNTLVMRSEVDTDARFDDFLEDLKDTVLAAHENQHVPFNQVVNTLSTQRNLNSSPLFQVLFAMQNSVTQGTQWQDLALREIAFESPAAKYDVNWEIHDNQQHLNVMLEFRSSLFQASTMQRWLQQWQQLLMQIVTQQQPSIGALSVLSRVEREQQLVNWQGAQQSWDTPKVLAIALQQQADKSPDSCALIAEDQHWSYQQLHARANQLAHALQAQGIGRDQVVGLCMSRSSEMVVAILAIIKVGAAYLPLDPELPVARLEFMLDDAGSPLVLTQAQWQGVLPATVPSWNVDKDCAQQYSTAQLCVNYQSTDLAYVIYTSGSTGQPKGVMSEHAALMNRLNWMQQTFAIDATDCVLQKTPYSFDVSVWELFWPLLNGASLVMAKPDGHKDSGYLVQMVQQYHITTLHFVPSMLQAFAIEPELKNCHSLRQVFASGEALSLELQQQFMGVHSAALHNLYGPTEAAIDVSWWQCDRHSARNCVPIGKPIANTQLYILNAQQQLLPTGAVGELYIGGAGLARGYLKRPELNAKSFIEHPFNAGERLYRTGDLCRYLSGSNDDGNIEYLGRIDHQVKLRGLRIELGEINSALLKHTNIREAITLLRDDLSSAQLVAYVTLQGAPLDEQQLTTQLLELLPKYMLPNNYVVMDALPLSANGKLDRKQLPAPQKTQSQQTVVAIQGAQEQVLAELWAQLLKLDISTIGGNSNFFQLGGHSLLATLLLAKLRNSYKVIPSLRQVFEISTLSQLAEFLAEPVSERIATIAQQVRPAQLPLSFAQQRLWFLEQLDKDTAEYNISTAVELQGELHSSWLQRALQQVLARHEILRSRIVQHNNGPQLIIDSDSSIELAVSQWRGDAAQWRRHIQKLASTEAQRPFDLALDRLIRAQLVCWENQNSAVLLLSVHHTIADDWSMQILIDELALCYSAYAKEQTPLLSTLPIQYLDFSIYQRKQAQQQVHAQQLEYWKKQLVDADYVLQLPCDYKRTEEVDTRNKSVQLTLDEDLVQQLRTVAVQHNVTLYVLLMSVTQLLLGRLANQREVRIGTPIANRNHSETQGLIGCFINTLVISTQLREDDSISSLLARVKNSVLEAQENQQVPFEQIVDALLPTRELHRTPLFQVLFSMQNATIDAQQWQGLTLSEVPVSQPHSSFDLSWDVHDNQEELHVRLSYKQGLFSEQSIEHWLQIWQRLLAQVVAQDSDTALAQLRLLSDAQQTQQLQEWNNTQTNYAGDKTLSALLQEQQLRTPDALALIEGEQQLSYSQLHAQANQLAHALREQGVTRETIVAVCLERSQQMVVTLLAIIKAAAAYLPLDPELPVTRLALMVEDSAPLLILTESTSVLAQMDKQLWEGAPPLLWNLDECNFEMYASTALSVINQPEDLAYAIYTSGSTGMPKGVLNEHRGLVNRLNWMQQTFPINEQDRILQKTPYSFDVSVWEFFWPLMTGASIVVAKAGGHKDSAYLTQQIVQHKVTTLHFVPSMLSAFVDELQLAQCASVRQVFTSGEALPLELQQRFFAVHNAQLINLYGPTEAAIDVSYWQCQVDTPLDFVPIGKPIANTQLYVLDDCGQLLPQGAIGELYIGGEGLARGYLKRAELTQACFIEDGLASGKRLYRTGDRCRLMDDGNIQYLGRIDHQVKLRGLRIELGEIDVQLQRQEQIKTAVTVLREDMVTPQLVAYFTSPTTDLDISQLQAQLALTLPEYMVPKLMLQLKELPLSSNGKIDRKRLPKPDVQSEQWQAPSTEAEITLCTLMQTLLKLERVGINDNFFALGGDSILGLQLISQAKAQGLGITPKQLFQQKTLGELALVATAVESTKIEQGVLHGDVPLLPIQQWFLKRQLARPGHWNQAVLLHSKQPLEESKLQATLTALVTEHDSLRLRFSQHDGIWTQRYAELEKAFELTSSTLDKPLTQINMQGYLEQSVELDFDLSNGPLLRAHWLQDSTHSHYLYITAHHLVVDGISWRILLEDFKQLWAAQVTGEQVQPLQRTSSYRQWSQRIHTYAQQQPIAQQRNYWQQQAVAMPLAVDLPDQPNLVADEVNLTEYLSTELTSQLQDAHQTYRTQGHELLISALAVCLQKHGAHNATDKIRIDLEGHGREALFEQIDTSRTLGWFTSLYPVALDLPAVGSGDDKSLTENIVAVKEQLRAIPEQGIGFGLLSYLTHSAVEQAVAGEVLFNFLGKIDLGEQDDSFSVLDIPLPASSAAQNTRSHELEIVVSIMGERLQVEWKFSAKRWQIASAQGLLNDYVATLEVLIKHCLQRENGKLSPADFPLAKDLNQASLNKLLTKLKPAAVSKD
jgi:amino acid adenylation domain-containing protein/non-ribosomal peptide synthase protein (TIGR01720 family)